ncbi:MAG: alanine--tRNA ligase [Gammaproteobacteria bacterium]|nr:alanine--tRNA ligase [Gammaproteobacteria bacterium]
MKSAEIRQRFLDYFNRNGHEVVASAPLIPGNDPTLLFTNAGMNQFKDVFLGQDTRSYVRAASSQRCLRAGGKHNDLENVGYTARHHTFFEMLGNFSFGDYFKKEAIEFAWEFLTREMKLPEERLWVTVYKDDQEAEDLWLKHMGVNPDRFSRLGEKDNFWSMGDTGPCGPCSEIFYDHGADVAGGPPGTPDEDGDRYVEIWNLVFMQFNRAADGAMTPLPKPSVDTGMGLERISAVMQGVHSNYEIDLFQGLIGAIADLLKVKDRQSKSLNVIADHIRACAFLVLDGIFPSNEGRGYVLRRIMRRAIRHGHHLGATEPFFYKLVRPLIDQMGGAYPELARTREQIEKVLRQEEERFAETLDHGMRVLEDAIASLKADTIPGDVVFQLYDTYGFPVDLTADIARERELKVDMAGFNQAMDAQRERARSASSFKTAQLETISAPEIDAEFTGYAALHGQAKIQLLHAAAGEGAVLNEGEEGVIFLDRTPFYAESGGQVGDRGRLVANGAVFEVLDTQKGHAHIGKVIQGKFELNAAVECEVDSARREATAFNHSATHLMHAALRKVLGEHVQQKGSLVDPQRLRFDFSHFEAVTSEQLREIESLVNAEIRQNNEVDTREMSVDAAMQAGAMALFGEKYGDLVRVVGMGGFSKELCGGTHVKRTGDIGLFRITSESGVAAGVRRIEAVTGAVALEYVRSKEDQLDRVAGLLKAKGDDVEAKVSQLNDRLKHLEKELTRAREQLAAGSGDALLDQVVEINGIKVLAANLDGADSKTLRDTMDRLKDKLQEAVIVLAAVDGDKVSLVAGVTKALTGQFKAGDLIRDVAAMVGGKGGGRPDMAQAGGNHPEKLPEALALVSDWVRSKIS